MRNNNGGKIKITGSGFYVPEKILTNADLEKIVDTSDEWIVTRTGIKERHVCAPEEACSDLAVKAAHEALKDAEMDISEIDLIILATATPDTLIPSTACWVQKGLNADHVPAFDIAAGCSGFIYGMILGESLILCGAHKKILLIGAESLTKAINWQDRNTCVLFGDAAAAAILEKSQDDSGMLSSYWKADGYLADLLCQPAGGSRIPICQEVIDAGNHFITMRGNEVFKHAVKRMGEAAEIAIKRAGLKKEDIDYLIPHQANIRIIDATGRRLNLPPDKVFSNIHKYGNVSAATVPIAYHEMKESGMFKKGDNIVMVAFGAGFTWGAITYRI